MMMNRFQPPTRPASVPVDKALRSVHIGNVGYDVNENDLRDIFSQVGPVISLRLINERDTGKPKGYGFCEYMDPETATACLRTLDGVMVKGRKLRLSSAVMNASLNEDLLQPPQRSAPPSSALRPRSPQESLNDMYGPPPLNGKTPEAIAKTLSKCSPTVMFELMKDMKNLATTNPQQCRQMLDTNPQLAFALLQAQVMMHWLDTDTAFNLLDRKMPAEKATEPPAPQEPAMPPRQPLRPNPAQQQQQQQFRPPPPQQQQQPETQFYQPPMSSGPPAGPFRQFFPQQSQGGPPPQQRPSGPWNPPGRMPNAPPPQNFSQPPRFKPPPSNEPPASLGNDNFRNFGPPTNYHNPPPRPMASAAQPSAFRQSIPTQRFQSSGSQRRSNDMHEDDGDDIDVINQLLQLSDDQLNQLPPHEAAKIRDLRTKLSQR